LERRAMTVSVKTVSKNRIDFVDLGAALFELSQLGRRTTTERHAR